MRAMILAAGRGERMGELTRDQPKPLLCFRGRYLIEYSILSLVKAGISEIIINISYQREQIKLALGNGERYGAKFTYSEEPTRLETGGGILQALPLLGKEPFLVISSDIVTDYPLIQLVKSTSRLKSLAHLVMVDNPAFKPQGDFGLSDGYLHTDAKPALTFANIGIYHPALFAANQPGIFPLYQVLIDAIPKRQITGEHYQGFWCNIGTPQDLMSATENLSFIE